MIGIEQRVVIGVDNFGDGAFREIDFAA